MQLKIILILAGLVFGFVSGCLKSDYKVSRLNEKIKDKDSIILVTSVRLSVVSVANDSLMQIIKDKSTNANTINLQFDKTKLKNGSTLVIDSKQLQTLSCDTVNIVKWYEGLPRKEQRKYR